ncbi:trans-Golgi network integral membrane protein 2-like isoform X2 [Rhopilema esculentum]|uniref:trans-Golgi network integral membrane protein 2-like isoform X2 n=1 Tax=Rhopilema esculentum TaxID=499914 RepID=UPI0031E27B01
MKLMSWTLLTCLLGLIVVSSTGRRSRSRFGGKSSNGTQKQNPNQRIPKRKPIAKVPQRSQFHNHSEFISTQPTQSTVLASNDSLTGNLFVTSLPNKTQPKSKSTQSSDSTVLVGNNTANHSQLTTVSTVKSIPTSHTGVSHIKPTKGPEKPNTHESKTDGSGAGGENVETNTDGSGAEGEEVGTNTDGSGAEEEKVGTSTDEENGRSWIKRFHPAFPRKTAGSLSVLFLVGIVLVLLFYALFHNRRRIIGFVVEGRNGRPNSRNYKKLEEAMPSLRKTAA